MASGLHSLATIIKRLEAATSRIEDLASGSVWPATTPGGAIVDAGAQPSPSAVPETPRSVVAFDEAVIDGKLKPFIELTKSFAGPNVVKIIEMVEKQFKDMRGLLVMSAACRKPDTKEMETLMGPFSVDISHISQHKESNRKDRDWYTHLTVIGEGAVVIGWVVQDKPGPAINEIKDTVLFYGNRVMKEFKEKDPKHTEWVKSYLAILEELRKYVMEYHTTGLAWNPKGISISEFKASSGSSANASGPPPPPPPPPSAPLAPPPPPAAVGASVGGTAAVFADLNRGADVTKGLRKVDKSEMTHKNPALRATGVVPSTVGIESKKPVRPSKPQSLMGKKPAKLALEGKSWAIEYQEDEKSIVLEECELHQAVNIFGCKNSIIQIKGKITAVTVVNCTKTSIVVESVVSSISITKSPSFELQVTGVAPMIQIDSTDSGQIFLSKASLDVEVTTAKCSSINVSLPVGSDEQPDFEEQAVPEMLRTVVKDGKLLTTVVEHVG